MPSDEGGRFVDARDSARKWVAMALLLSLVGQRYARDVEARRGRRNRADESTNRLLTSSLSPPR